MLNKKTQLAVGIDPTSGHTSKLGFAVIDIETMTIVDVKAFQAPKTPDLRARIKYLLLALSAEFKKLEELNQTYSIFFESTVMRGKGGESYQRAIGAMIAITPSHRPIYEVNNKSVKAYITGNGNAQKDEIGPALMAFIEDPRLVDLIVGKRYDELDSIAIALAGYERNITREKLTSGKSKNILSKPLKVRAPTKLGK